MLDDFLKKMIKYFIITFSFVLLVGLGLHKLRETLDNSSPYVTIFICVALMGCSLGYLACAGSRSRHD